MGHKESIPELDENPYYKFNIAFAVLTVIPFLTFLYLIFVRLPFKDISSGELGALLASVTFLVICGACFGYGIIRRILNRILFFAAHAKQSEQRKSAFVAAVSHDLKTPLAILKTHFFNISSGILGQVNPEQNKALAWCDHAIDHMNNLINGLLGLYKLESGVWGFNRKMCDVGAIADEVAGEVRILFDQKNIKLRTDRQGGALLIWADQSNIKSIVSNLLSNAIKYAPEGTEVALRAFPQGAYSRLECSDAGPGIPPDKINKLFHRFERFDTATEGTGLGLFIVKQIVETLKGKIWVESGSGGGTTFVVLLPRDPRKTRDENHG